MSARAYYDRYWTSDGFNPSAEGPFPELRAVLDEHARAGDAWLDVGCGDGTRSGLWLHNRGCRYVGADISATAVEQARAHGLEALVVQDAAELPFEDDAFAGVLAVEVLEHVFEPQRAVREVYRILKPGGVLFVSLPNVAYWRRRMELLLLGRFDPMGDDLSMQEPWRDPHIRFFTPSTMMRMLTAAGYEAEVHGYAGAFLADLPKVGRFFGARQSPLYRWAQARIPDLLGRRIYAVAVKPAL